LTAFRRQVLAVRDGDELREKGTVPNSLYQPVASDSGTGFDCHIFLQKARVNGTSHGKAPLSRLSVINLL